MSSPLPPMLQFNPELVRAVSQEEESVAASFHAVEQIADEFSQEYLFPAYEVPKRRQIEAAGGNLMHLFQSDLILFHLLQGRRIAEHLADVIQSLNERRLLAATLALRATLEVTAAVVYYVGKMKETLPDGDLSDEDLQRFGALLDKAIRGGRFDWKRWASGAEERRELHEAYEARARKKAEEPKPELVQTNVVTMVQHLAEEMGKRDKEQQGKVGVFYALLSDMCHPSVGATLPALLSHPDRDRSLVRPDVSDSLMNWFWREVTSPLVHPVVSFAKTWLDRVDEIAGSFEFCAEAKAEAEPVEEEHSSEGAEDFLGGPDEGFEDLYRMLDQEQAELRAKRVEQTEANFSQLLLSHNRIRASVELAESQCYGAVSSVYTLMKRTSPHDFTHWHFGGRCVQLRRLHRYLCVVKGAWRLGFVRVGQTRITFTGEGLDSLPVSLRLTQLLLEFETPQDPRGLGHNLVCVLHLTEKKELSLIVKVWFDLQRLDLAEEPKVRRKGATRDEYAQMREFADWIGKNWSAVAPILEAQVLTPFKYQSNLLGKQANEFFGAPGKGFDVRLAQLSRRSGQVRYFLVAEPC